MTPTRTSRAAAAVVVAVALALSGCSLRVSDMSLPGGTDTGDDPILIKAEFRDVLDLVPQSTVKVNDVSVGKITDIQLDGETAVVTMELPRSTDLPDNTVAEIRQTSLLGEKFVQLSPPETEASSGQLQSGDVIKLADTGRNPEVEEVLGALSLLLNGGGVAQLQTITRELNYALEGREDSVKSVFRQIEDLTSQLDEGKADIVRAIEGLNRLSISVSDQIGTIDAALRELPSALRTIDKQRGDLVKMLRSLNELSDVGVRVIQASKQSTIESFRQLVPVLTKFSESGDAFVDAFHVFLTYPFVDDVVGRDPQVARTLQMGDYTNLSINLQVKLHGRGRRGRGSGGAARRDGVHHAEGCSQGAGQERPPRRGAALPARPRRPVRGSRQGGRRVPAEGHSPEDQALSAEPSGRHHREADPGSAGGHLPGPRAAQGLLRRWRWWRR